MTKKLCIIPARGGSKRFPRKNVASLDGKPLLFYAIDAALECGLFDLVCVSSEDEEILEIAGQSNKVRPLKRADDLATDTVKLNEVCVNVLETLKEEGSIFDNFTMLLPGSPLRTANDISEAYRLFEEKDANSVMSVTKCSHPPQNSLRINNQNEIEPWLGKDQMDRSQLLEPLYRCDGAIYIAKTEVFLKEKELYGSQVIPYVIPVEKSVDIDYPIDLEWAEFLLKKSKVANS